MNSINNWTVASIVITSKCQMCTWRIAANPKGAIFPPSVLLFVYLAWLSCPHLFVSRSDGVPTRRRLRCWERPPVRKQLTFPLDVLEVLEVLGLHLSPGGCRALPSSPGSPSNLLALLGVDAGLEAGSQQICLVAGPQLQLLTQCPILAVRLAGWCQLEEQALASYVPYLCKRCCNGNSYLGLNRPGD